MAIAFDSSSKGNGASPLTVAHTCSGLNRVLVVYQRGVVASSITYDGVALTLLTTLDWDSSSDRLHLWYLIQPNTGTHDLVVTASSPQAVATSSTGCNRSVTNWVTNRGFTTATSIDVSTTTTQDNSWIVMGVTTNNSGAPFTAGTNQTLRQTNDNNRLVVGDTNGAITPAGSTHTIINQTPNDGIGAITLAIDPYIPLSITVTDTITSSDTVAFNRGKAITVTDTITSSDVVTTVRNVIITVLDTITSSDETTASATWINETKHTTTWTNEMKH